MGYQKIFSRRDGGQEHKGFHDYLLFRMFNRILLYKAA
jgi:hypothetical protein